MSARLLHASEPFARSIYKYGSNMPLDVLKKTSITNIPQKKCQQNSLKRRAPPQSSPIVSTKIRVPSPHTVSVTSSIQSGTCTEPTTTPPTSTEQNGSIVLVRQMREKCSNRLFERRDNGVCVQRSRASSYEIANHYQHLELKSFAELNMLDVVTVKIRHAESIVTTRSILKMRRIQRKLDARVFTFLKSIHPLLEARLKTNSNSLPPSIHAIRRTDAACNLFLKKKACVCTEIALRRAARVQAQPYVYLNSTHLDDPHNTHQDNAVFRSEHLAYIEYALSSTLLHLCAVPWCDKLSSTYKSSCQVFCKSHRNQCASNI
jgi:hypothetical protein